MLQPKIESGRAIFNGACNGQTWKAGQTLTIGTIVDYKGEKHDSLILEPQGIAHLISDEEICLPQDVCALAHVLTRKCNDGLLTLNIGVIDPGWSGKISTPILNFSSSKQLLSKGDKFIRVTFHRVGMETSIPSANGVSPSEDDYVRSVRSRAVNSFGQYFLNIRYLVNQLASKENARLRSTLLKYIPIAAFSLAVFAFFVTLGGLYATRLVAARGVSPEQGRAASQAEVQRLDAKVADLAQAQPIYQAKIHELEGRLRTMERQAAESQPVRPRSSKLDANEVPRP